jgi:adenosylhomocysteine nucleosidase
VIDGSAPPPAADARPVPSNPVVAARSRGIVGVVAALPAEARCLAGTGLRFARPVTVGDQMVVCLSGVGGTGAGIAARLLVAAGATALVSWGVAAGLDLNLPAGTLVVTSEIITGEADRPIRHAPTPVSRAWAANVASSVRDRVSLSGGPIVGVDHVLERIADKRALASTGAVAADMETAAVAHAARSARVPWIAVRAIVDDASVAMPRGVIGAIDALGRPRIGPLIGALVRRPSELLQLPGLARHFRVALGALNVAARAVGPSLMAPVLAPNGCGLAGGETAVGTIA